MGEVHQVVCDKCGIVAEMEPVYKLNIGIIPTMPCQWEQTERISGDYKILCKKCYSLYIKLKEDFFKKEVKNEEVSNNPNN